MERSDAFAFGLFW